MAVSILERPEGYILSSTPVLINIVDAGGDAGVQSGSHGLSSGDIVYITTSIEDYNGFVQVEPDSANSFYIYPLDATVGDTPSRIQFIQELTQAASDFAQYYISNLTHGFSAVHLPISYKLTNTRWPVNSVDSAQTILTLNDDLGLARLTVSGSLGTFEDLSFVKISGASNSDFNGVYQILDKLSTTNITLNVSYGTFTNSGLIGATIQLYYGNYNIVVRVYAGINSSHEWAAQKPYELAATLELIPDTDNTAFFSINEILKAYVKSVNNLLLGTMPNNIDAWVNFYIQYAEQYDSSDGYTVGTTLSGFTSDLSNFEGTAVNAILPFKNVYSGHLSEYLMTNNTAKFLTLFTIPVLFQCGDNTPDCYNDISFLNPYNDLHLTLRKEFYNNGNGPITVDTDLGTLDSGVIRAEIEADCSYDRVDISLRQSLQNGSFDGSLSGWENFGFGSDWTYASGAASVTSAALSKRLRQGFIFVSGKQYTIEFDLTNTGATATMQVTLTDNGAGEFWVSGDVLNPTIDPVVAGHYSFIFTPDAEYQYINFYTNSNGVSQTITIDNVEIHDPLSETKQFDIDCGCADQEIRLTWLNPLGGFDYWAFKSETGHAIDITTSQETTKNIFPEWPKSYGEFSDTIRKQVSRESTNRLFFTTQYLTEDQADAVAYIKTSPLVQIINSKSDRRTIIVDSDSFTKYTDNQKLITISFSARYTDNIGSQKV